MNDQSKTGGGRVDPEWMSEICGGLSVLLHSYDGIFRLLSIDLRCRRMAAGGALWGWERSHSLRLTAGFVHSGFQLI
ncbi:hypothetical protein PSAC2689_200095 [Paraburkholderia sacchari]